MRTSGRDRRAQCDGKRSFRTPGHAGDGLNRLVWRNSLNIFDFAIYPCPHCHRWHIGRTKYITYEIVDPQLPKAPRTGKKELPTIKVEKPPEPPKKEKKEDRERPKVDLDTHPGQLILFRRSHSKRIILWNEIGF